MRVTPISVFIHYHVKMVRLASKGKLTPQELEKLDAELNALLDTILKINRVNKMVK